MEEMIRKMERDVGSLVEAYQRQEPGKLPSHTKQANALAILRSGKVLENKSIPERANISVDVSGDTGSTNEGNK